LAELKLEVERLEALLCESKKRIEQLENFIAENNLKVPQENEEINDINGELFKLETSIIKDEINEEKSKFTNLQTNLEYDFSLGPWMNLKYQEIIEKCEKLQRKLTECEEEKHNLSLKLFETFDKISENSFTEEEKVIINIIRKNLKNI
jgi:hypothetical protein